MRRRVYKCKDCNYHFYPLDHHLEIARSSASKRFAKISAMMSVFAPFEHVRTMLSETLDIQVSRTFLSQIAHRIGSKFYQQAQQNQETFHSEDQGPETLYIQADGAMVPISGEEGLEFKENKLGLVFCEEDIEHRRTKNGKEHTEIHHKRFTTSLAKGTEEFKEMLYNSAKSKGLEQAKTTIFLSDGAGWLRKYRREYYPGAIQILDWYHVVDHLWATAHKLWGETQKQKSEKWVEPLKELLWEGKTIEVLDRIREQALKRKTNQTPLWELHTYLVNNKDFMRYPEYRSKGYYIGSGAIESANKYVVANRMKMAGMRWSIQKANSLIWLRCKYFEDQWDSTWEQINLREYLDWNPDEQMRESA